MTNLLSELNRRNVTRVALLYAGISWLVIQIAETVLPIFDVPTAFLRLLIILLVIGFAVTLVLAWFYDVTPDGVVRDGATERSNDAVSSGRGMNLAIGVVLVAAGAAFVGNQAGWFGPTVAPDPTFEPQAETLSTAEPTLVKGVAVLPFENLSEAQENAFFASGVHDEILTNLAVIRDFRVISRTSVRGYAETQLRVPEIARQLGVSHVMEGSVRRSEDRVRVTVLLIDAATDQQIWSASYDRTLVDIFDIQSDIARQIVANIQGELSPETAARIGGRSTTDTRAYDLYLRARAGFQSDVRSAVILEEPFALIRRALEIDPAFVEAWVELVRICGGRVWWDQLEYTDCATDALAQVRLLAPESPQRVMAEGIYAYRVERDFDRAFEILRSAESDLPNNATLIQFIGYAARRTGRWDEALRAMRKVILLDPRDASSHDDIAVTLAASGDWQEAIRFAEEASASFPENKVLPFIAADFRRSYEGDLEEYAAAVRQMPPELRANYGNPWIDGVFATHEERRQWVAEAVGSGIALSIYATGVEATHRTLSGKPEKARTLGKEAYRQVQILLGENWEQESVFNLALMAMVAAGAGEEAVARRAIELHAEHIAREQDALMEVHRVFIVRAWLSLGEIDRAWQELRVLMDVPIGPTVRDLRQNLVYRHYFSDYPPYRELVGSYIQ